MYTFRWPTRSLCVRELWLNGTYDATTQAQEFTRHYLSTVRATTTRIAVISSSDQIPSFVIISLVLVIIVLLLVLFNNLPRIVQSRYCRLCRQGCLGSVCTTDQLFECCDCVSSVKWFGSVRRRLTPRRRTGTRLHGK